MARQKTAKVHKSSYTERVLGAMTQIQKEHRKHAIHMATLRAQVRKNAEEKADKLGPQWVHWVGKAVHKLVEDGLIEHAHSTQEVTFTTEGKDLIAKTKKQVDSEGDDLWRTVSTTIRRGRKRRRSSTGLTQASSPSVSVSVTKRRRSTGTAGHSTTASRSRRKSNQTVTFRGLSPLTDLPTDDGGFRERRESASLREKDKEIEALRERLEILSQKLSTSSTTRHRIPEVVIPRPGPSAGITRTQSGTIIPNLSKQPTPAPSDSDSQSNHPDIGMLTPPRTEAPELHDDSSLPDELEFPSPHHTPSASPPSRPPLRSPADSHSSSAALRAQIADLKSNLADQGEQSRLLRLEIDTQRSRLEDARMESALALERTEDSAEQLKCKTHSMAIKDAWIEELALEKERTERDLVEVAKRVDELEAEVARKDALLRDVERGRADADLKVHELGEKVKKLESEAVDLWGEVELCERLVGELNDKVVERDEEIVGLKDNLRNVQSSNFSLVERLTTCEEKLQATEAELSKEKLVGTERDLELTQLVSSVRKAEEERDEAVKTIEKTQIDLRYVQAELQVGRALLESAKKEGKAKDSTIAEMSAHAEVHAAELETLRSASERDAEAQQQLNHRVAELEMAAASAQTEAEALGKELGDTQMKLADALKEVSRLKIESNRIQKVLEGVQGELVGARGDERQLKENLETEVKRAEALRQQKSVLESEVKALEQQNVVISTASARLSAEVESLKAMLREAMLSQTESLHSLVEKAAALGISAPSAATGSATAMTNSTAAAVNERSRSTCPV